MSLIIYLIKTILISGTFFSYYWCFLRNRSFHGYNRFFLVGTAALSPVIPFIHIPAGFPGATGSGNPIPLLSITRGDWEEAIRIGSGSAGMSPADWQVIGLSAYGLVSLILLLSLIRSVEYLQKLSRTHLYHALGDLRCYETNEPGTPFSFFQHIFWNGTFNAVTDARNPIFLHERYHAEHRHSADRLFFQLLTTLFWCNPFFFPHAKRNTGTARIPGR